MFWYAVYKNRQDFVLVDAMNKGECTREELESISYDARMSGWFMSFGPVEEPAASSKELTPEMAGL